AVFGFPVSVLAGQGRWSALMGTAFLPWALVAVTGPRPRGLRARLRAAGTGIVSVMVVPWSVAALGLVPLLFALGLQAVRRLPPRPLVALFSTAGAVVGVSYLYDRSSLLLDGTPIGVPTRLVPMALLAAAVLLAMVAGSWRVGFVAG